MESLQELEGLGQGLASLRQITQHADEILALGLGTPGVTVLRGKTKHPGLSRPITAVAIRKKKEKATLGYLPRNGESHPFFFLHTPDRLILASLSA